MPVPIAEPKPLLASRPTDDGPRIRKAGPPAEPWLGFDRIAQWEQPFDAWHQTVKLHRAGQSVASSELDPGRQSNPLVHRSEHIARFPVDHWACQSGVGRRSKMAMLATLVGEW